MGFSRQEYWSGLPFPSPGDLPDPGIKPRSSALQADALPSEPPGKPKETIKLSSTVAVPFHIPAMLKSSHCSIFLSVFRVVSVLDLVHSNRYLVESHCCFNLHFPDDI